MRRIAIAITLALVLAIPVAADAASVDQTSDRTALTAYSTYLGSIGSRADLGKSDDAALIKTATGSCKGALSPAIANPSPTKKSEAALSDVGEEIGGDVAVKFLDEAHRPYTKLAHKLNALHWKGKGVANTVHAFVKAMNNVLTISQSHLCRDVLNLSSKLSTEPAGTKTFLNRYLSASKNLETRLTALVSLMERYETKSDAKLVTTIDSRANKFNNVSSADEKASRTKLLAVLKQS